MAEHTDGMENEVAAFVMDALEPQEAAAVRAHLDSCASCRDLERRLRRVVASVPLAAEEAMPPPRLRDRVLAAAGAEAEAGTARPRAVVAPPSRRPRPRRPWLQVGLAAAVAAIVILAGWNVFLTQQLKSTSRPQQGLAATTVVLSPTSAGTIEGGRGKLVWLPSKGVAIVEFSQLPQAPPGRVYQLWVGPNASHVQSAGVFLPEQDGSKVLLVDRNLEHDRLVAVTLEPAPDGSLAPTQSPGLLGRL